MRWVRWRFVLLAGAVSVAALAGLGARAQPGATDPHGGYSEATEACLLCHDPHAAASRKLGLMETERETCYQCHSASGGATNVRGQFGEATIGSSSTTSVHPVPGPSNGEQLACSDCHSPHMARADATKLLRARIGGGWVTSPPGEPIGDAFCYACHGSDSAYPAPFGDHSSFGDSVHGTNGGVPLPPSGSGIKCLACHEPHGSDFIRLTTASEENLCYTCHTRADPNTSGGSNPRGAFNAADNDYLTSDGTPIRIFHHPIEASDQAGGTRVVECSSCHNVHVVDRTDSATTSKIVDPTDTTTKWIVSWDAGSADMTRGNISDWCITCHVAPDVTAPIPPGPNVPYFVLLANDDARDDDGNVHDKFSASQWANEAAHGPTGADLACTACHDFHGSSNAYMLREQVVSPDGSGSSTVTGFGAVEADWAILQSFCLTCHPSRGVNHGANKLCTQCHSHGNRRL